MPRNGTDRRDKRLANAAPSGLCAETQGRQIVAAMVNDAVEEALGLGLSGIGGRADVRTPRRRSAPVTRK